MGRAPQITASSPLQVLAQSLLFQMRFASTQLFQLLAQQMLRHYQLLPNLLPLFAQR
jgi:hypothetical protein